MPLEFRPPGDADWPAFAEVMQETFMERWPDGVTERMRKVGDLGRAIAGFDGPRLEATGGAYKFEMQVPGAVLPCTGITWITVSARQRRRGALREMMRRLHEVGAAAGEPIAALYAAEGEIYNRFGFGVAGRYQKVRVGRRHLAALRAPAGRVIELGRAEAAARFPEVFAAVNELRPGIVVRNAAWWERVFHIAESEAPGFMGPRYLLYEDAAGRDRGIAIARLRGSDAKVAASECRVSELHFADAEAGMALWRYAGSFDLVSRVTAHMRPADEALPFMVSDLRRVRLRADHELWVHVTNPLAALGGRRYNLDGQLRLAVSDPAWPSAAGTYQLEVSGGAPQVNAVDVAPDLEMGADALGSTYMGTVSPLTLLASGRIRELTPGAARTAHNLFHWAPSAWCPDMW